MPPYLAGYFQDLGATDDQRLYLGVSSDGTRFVPLSRVATNGSVRDPSILPPSVAPDGKWHVAVTNHSFNSTIPNNTVDIYTGSTLAGISPVPLTVDCSAAKTSGTVNWAWAPEWFKDTDGTVWFIVATSTSGQSVDLASFSSWAYPATNAALTTFGAPVKMVGLPLGFDCYVVKVGATYYSFVKGGTIEMWTASSFPAGPWTSVLTGTQVTTDAGNAEGPNVTNMGGGRWRCYYDKLDEDGRIKYTESTDGFVTFGAPAYVVSNDRMRHAGIIDLATESLSSVPLSPSVLAVPSGLNASTEKRWGPGVHDNDGRVKAVMSDTSGAASTPIDQSAAATSLANVASSASSVTLQAANTARRGWTAFNDSSQVLYVKFGATASATSYAAKIPAGGYFEMPRPIYTGVIDGIWASAQGSAKVTEIT